MPHRFPRPATAGCTARIWKPYGPQPATGEPAVGNRTARNRQPESPQLENEVLHPAFLHYTCCKTTKPMSYSDIKPQSLERSALEKQRFLTTVNKFRFT